MDIKNIPVSLHVQYIFFTNIYLSYIINSSLNTLLQSTLVYSPVYSEKSHCSLATCAKARLSCLDRSIKHTVGKLHVTQASGAFIHYQRHPT